MLALDLLENAPTVDNGRRSGRKRRVQHLLLVAGTHLAERAGRYAVVLELPREPLSRLGLGHACRIQLALGSWHFHKLGDGAVRGLGAVYGGPARLPFLVGHALGQAAETLAVEHVKPVAARHQRASAVARLDIRCLGVARVAAPVAELLADFDLLAVELPVARARTQVKRRHPFLLHLDAEPFGPLVAVDAPGVLRRRRRGARQARRRRAVRPRHVLHALGYLWYRLAE